MERTVTIALSTAPYLIPVCLTNARLTFVRPLSPSWFSARDNAVRACPSPRAAKVAVSRQDLVSDANDRLHRKAAPIQVTAAVSKRRCARERTNPSLAI